MAFFLVDGIVSSWREDVKNHILTDFCRSACFACQLTGLCHPAAFYKVWIHLYIELHCRQFNIASQYVAGIDLHFSGPHWCIVFFVSFWLALYGRVPGLSCPSSQLYIWGSCYPRVTHTIIHHIRYPTQNYRFLENLFYEIRLWNIWDLVKPTLVVSANPIYIWYLTIGSLFKERRGRRIAKLRHQHNYGNLAPTLWRPAQCWFKQGVWV